MTVPSEQTLSPAAIRVLISTEIRLYLDGLAEILNRENEIKVVGRAENLRSLLIVTSKTLPDVILLDMSMSDSLVAITEIRNIDASIKIIALGVRDVEDDIIALAETGISAFVLRTATIGELIDTVRSRVCGELKVTPKIAAGLFERVGALAAANSVLDDTTRVTRREIDIVKLIDQGLSNKEIATKLSIEVSTVKNHVHNLLEKMHVKRRGQVAARLRHRLGRATH